MSKLVLDFIFDSSRSISSLVTESVFSSQNNDNGVICTHDIYCWCHMTFIAGVCPVTWDLSESFHQNDHQRDVQNPSTVQGRKEYVWLRKGVCSFHKLSASIRACSSFLIRKERRTSRWVINHTGNILHLYKHNQCPRFNSHDQPKPSQNTRNQNPSMLARCGVLGHMLLISILGKQRKGSLHI